MRCFLFQEFQLASTLEEFERILSIPLKGKGSYVKIGHPLKVEKLVEALNIEVSRFAGNVKTWGNAPGFLQSFLEKKAREFSTSRDMMSFNNVLSLLVYGLVLYPSTENFVDFAAISVFWTVRTSFVGEARNEILGMSSVTWHRCQWTYDFTKDYLILGKS